MARLSNSEISRILKATAAAQEQQAHRDEKEGKAKARAEELLEKQKKESLERQLTHIRDKIESETEAGRTVEEMRRDRAVPIAVIRSALGGADMVERGAVRKMVGDLQAEIDAGYQQINALRSSAAFMSDEQALLAKGNSEQARILYFANRKEMQPAEMKAEAAANFAQMAASDPTLAADAEKRNHGKMSREDFIAAHGNYAEITRGLKEASEGRIQEYIDDSQRELKKAEDIQQNHSERPSILSQALLKDSQALSNKEYTDPAGNRFSLKHAGEEYQAGLREAIQQSGNADNAGIQADILAKKMEDECGNTAKDIAKLMDPEADAILKTEKRRNELLKEKADYETRKKPDETEQQYLAKINAELAALPVYTEAEREDARERAAVYNINGKKEEQIENNTKTVLQKMLDKQQEIDQALLQYADIENEYAAREAEADAEIAKADAALQNYDNTVFTRGDALAKTEEAKGTRDLAGLNTQFQALADSERTLLSEIAQKENDINTLLKKSAGLVGPLTPQEQKHVDSLKAQAGASTMLVGQLKRQLADPSLTPEQTLSLKRRINRLEYEAEVFLSKADKMEEKTHNPAEKTEEYKNLVAQKKRKERELEVCRGQQDALAGELEKSGTAQEQAAAAKLNAAKAKRHTLKENRKKYTDAKETAEEKKKEAVNGRTAINKLCANETARKNDLKKQENRVKANSGHLKDAKKLQEAVHYGSEKARRDNDAIFSSTSKRLTQYMNEGSPTSSALHSAGRVKAKVKKQLKNVKTVKAAVNKMNLINAAHGKKTLAQKMAKAFHPVENVAETFGGIKGRKFAKEHREQREERRNSRQNKKLQKKDYKAEKEKQKKEKKPESKAGKIAKKTASGAGRMAKGTVKGAAYMINNPVGAGFNGAAKIGKIAAKGTAKTAKAAGKLVGKTRLANRIAGSRAGQFAGRRLTALRDFGNRTKTRILNTRTKLSGVYDKLKFLSPTGIKQMIVNKLLTWLVWLVMGILSAVATVIQWVLVLVVPLLLLAVVLLIIIGLIAALLAAFGWLFGLVEDHDAQNKSYMDYDPIRMSTLAQAYRNAELKMFSAADPEIYKSGEIVPSDEPLKYFASGKTLISSGKYDGSIGGFFEYLAAEGDDAATYEPVRNFGVNIVQRLYSEGHREEVYGTADEVDITGLSLRVAVQAEDGTYSWGSTWTDYSNAADTTSFLFFKNGDTDLNTQLLDVIRAAYKQEGLNEMDTYDSVSISYNDMDEDGNYKAQKIEVSNAKDVLAMVDTLYEFDKEDEEKTGSDGNTDDNDAESSSGEHKFQVAEAQYYLSPFAKDGDVMADTLFWKSHITEYTENAVTHCVTPGGDKTGIMVCPEGTDPDTVLLKDSTGKICSNQIQVAYTYNTYTGIKDAADYIKQASTQDIAFSSDYGTFGFSGFAMKCTDEAVTVENKEAVRRWYLTSLLADYTSTSSKELATTQKFVTEDATYIVDITDDSTEEDAVQYTEYTDYSLASGTTNFMNGTGVTFDSVYGLISGKDADDSTAAGQWVAGLSFPAGITGMICNQGSALESLNMFFIRTDFDGTGSTWESDSHEYQLCIVAQLDNGGTLERYLVPLATVTNTEWKDPIVYARLYRAGMLMNADKTVTTSDILRVYGFRDTWNTAEGKDKWNEYPQVTYFTKDAGTVYSGRSVGSAVTENTGYIVACAGHVKLGATVTVALLDDSTNNLADMAATLPTVTDSVQWEFYTYGSDKFNFLNVEVTEYGFSPEDDWKTDNTEGDGDEEKNKAAEERREIALVKAGTESGYTCSEDRYKDSSYNYATKYRFINSGDDKYTYLYSLFRPYNTGTLNSDTTLLLVPDLQRGLQSSVNGMLWTADMEMATVTQDTYDDGLLPEGTSIRWSQNNYLNRTALDYLLWMSDVPGSAELEEYAESVSHTDLTAK